MINEQTIKQLTEMKLHTMAHQLRQYLEEPVQDALSFEERLGIMVEQEWSERQARRLKFRLSRAKLREEACVEEINYRHPRKMDASVMQRLSTCQWIRRHESVIFTGPTGVGKTWLACALCNKACREGYTVLYKRIPRLLVELYVAHADGTYAKVMNALGKPDVLVLDDFGLAPLNDSERRDLFEVVEDRQGRKSTVITSQLKVKHWHEVIGEPTIADAIMDRVVSNSHRIEMQGKSLRPNPRAKATSVHHSENKSCGQGLADKGNSADRGNIEVERDPADKGNPLERENSINKGDPVDRENPMDKRNPADKQGDRSDGI